MYLNVPADCGLKVCSRRTGQLYKIYQNEKNGRKTIIMEYLLLILGFALLIKGADVFVDGSSSVARLLKVPQFIIGLTVVSV